MLLLVISKFIFGQSPDKISYQIVVRDNEGNLIVDHAIGLEISIIQGSSTGTVVYSETYSPLPKTNENGLATVEIGSGIPTSGKFSDITWSEGPFYLKTQTDPNGGTAYSISGTSQLLSVPFALHSNSVESIKETDPTWVGEANETTDIGRSGKVGIGTTTPAAILHTESATNGNVVFVGQIKAVPEDPPVSGTGTRMMWYPDKAAFRAGNVDGNQWDNANTGKFSVAFGNETIASGTGSTAMGSETTASGWGATAFGQTNLASGYGSIAIGVENISSGRGSIAMGSESTALKMGSSAFGYNTAASGEGSTSMGGLTTASGDYSIAAGEITTASGNYSAAFGHDTKASGHGATSIGISTIAASYASTALGRYNAGEGETTNWIPTDPIFEIGNGTSKSQRSNAMTVLKNGSVGIGTNHPVYLLQVGLPGDGTEARANAWNLLSDERLKEDLMELANPLEIINKINGYYFYWKTGNNESRQVGFMAQEVMKVFPEVVSEGKDNYLSIEYGKMVPLLLEALKQQQKIIDDQQKKIDELYQLILSEIHK